ncbi:DNA gyrase inhibitor YacG [Candidatus Poribacteria bacterium]|nr:DNA gyrase inhibitor YacG [Candidatus Poribacteria bacterium]
MAKKRKLKCPICGKDVDIPKKNKLPPNFPFCSKRCKLVDLGRWLNEEYKFFEPVSIEQDIKDDEE